MEFWGVEVKPKQSLKCEAGQEKILHLSQASLGEIKKDKGSENVPIFVKVNDQKLVIGTLSAENCAQIQYDLVFEKEFELSHGSKDASVFFVGYKSTMQDLGSEDEFSDSDSEDLHIQHQLTEKDVLTNNKEKPVAGKVAAVKDNSASAKSKPQTKKPNKAETPKANDEDDDDDDDEDDDDDSEEESDDDEVPKGLISSDDEDDEDEDDDDSSEDEKIKVKAENNKKRSADGLFKPSADKKAKLSTPAKQISDVKKGGKAAAATTPSAKQATKSPASGAKAKEQSAKSAGSVKCNSCSKPFSSENALQAHTKAKHSTSK